jgi:hypothetical protein
MLLHTRTKINSILLLNTLIINRSPSSKDDDITFTQIAPVGIDTFPS